MQKQKIYYIGKRNGEKHDNVMTVATEVQDDGTLRVGFAFCSRKDRFIKRMGRDKALGRMNSKTPEICKFSGHSADDIVALFNSKNIFHDGDDLDCKDLDSYVFKPQIWRNRKLANIEQTGITYLEG